MEKIFKIAIHRIPQTLVSDALRELMHKLLATEAPAFSDERTINKFLAHGDGRIQKLALPTNLVLPIEVRIYVSNSSYFGLINDSDFAWFLEHLEAETIPIRKYTVMLTSRNRAAIAYLTAQRAVEAMQKGQTAPIV